jgi:tetratricopeptide (TPR) repeat protein
MQMLNIFRYHDAIESLLTIALVRRHTGAKILSLHRLVQTQFRFGLKPPGNQEAFDNASKLLDSVFPSRPRKSHQMYSVWPICQTYLQHVLSLMENYREESSGPNKLRPSEQFLHLLINCARYLVETQAHVELGAVLDVATSAFEAWEDGPNNLVMLADILRNVSTMWLERGDAALCEDSMRRSIDLYHRCGDPDPYLLLAPYNHMGNVASQAQNYEESLEWLEKTEKLTRGLVDDGMKRIALGSQNRGRTLCLLGRVVEGQKKLETAIKEYIESENWAMLS